MGEFIGVQTLNDYIVAGIMSNSAEYGKYIDIIYNLQNLVRLYGNSGALNAKLNNLLTMRGTIISDAINIIISLYAGHGVRVSFRGSIERVLRLIRTPSSLRYGKAPKKSRGDIVEEIEGGSTLTKKEYEELVESINNMSKEDSQQQRDKLQKSINDFEAKYLNSINELLNVDDEEALRRVLTNNPFFKDTFPSMTKLREYVKEKLELDLLTKPFSVSVPKDYKEGNQIEMANQRIRDINNLNANIIQNTAKVNNLIQKKTPTEAEKKELSRLQEYVKEDTTNMTTNMNELSRHLKNIQSPTIYIGPSKSYQTKEELEEHRRQELEDEGKSKEEIDEILKQEAEAGEKKAEEEEEEEEFERAKTPLPLRKGDVLPSSEEAEKIALPPTTPYELIEEEEQGFQLEGEENILTPPFLGFKQRVMSGINRMVLYYLNINRRTYPMRLITAGINQEQEYQKRLLDIRTEISKTNEQGLQLFKKLLKMPKDK